MVDLRGGPKRLAPSALASVPRVLTPYLKGMSVIVRHHHDQEVFVILCPVGSRLRRSDATGESVLYVPTEEGEVPLFEEPSALLVQLSSEGRYGLRLLGVEDEAES